MDAYSLLEVTREASMEQLKANYHRILLKVHPDKCSGNATQFIKVHSAYRLLSNADSRAQYDNLRRQTELMQRSDIDDIEALLNLHDDFDLAKDGGCESFERVCRCGSIYVITQTELGKVYEEWETNAESFVLALECDSCSIVLNVLVI